MPEYEVQLTGKARKQLDKLSDNIADPIIEAIDHLAENPRPRSCKKLKGRAAYRIRKGKYRVIYEIKDKQLIVIVIAVGLRKDIYR
ncbi:MAG: type II toxin-antitoxin system RelE/ParE family toxin [Chitinophagales bacterium]